MYGASCARASRPAELQYLVAVRVRLLLLLRRDNDRIVNAQQARRGLQGRLQTLDLADRRLEHACLAIVDHLAVQQIQAVVQELAFGVTQSGILCSVVVRSQFGDEIGRVFGSVDGQGFRDDQEGSGELGNGELFSGALRSEL